MNKFHFRTYEILAVKKIYIMKLQKALKEVDFYVRNKRLTPSKAGTIKSQLAGNYYFNNSFTSFSNIGK